MIAGRGRTILAACLLSAAAASVAQSNEGEDMPEPQNHSAPLVQAVQSVKQTDAWAADWWNARHEAKLREKSSDANIELVLIGDSITHGWETEGKQAWSEYFGKYSTLNLGFSGDRTEHVIWRLRNGEVDGLSPRRVVLLIGVNNGGHRRDKPEDTAAGIEVILNELRTRLPDAKILLLAILPTGKRPDDPLRLLNEQVNRMIARYADKDRIVFCDIGKAFLDENGVLSNSIMPDFLHPNDRGYRIFAEALKACMDR